MAERCASENHTFVPSSKVKARIYTDSVESFEVKVQADTGHRQAAIDFVKLAREHREAKQTKGPQRTVDMQEQTISRAEAVEPPAPSFEKGTRKARVVRDHQPEYHPTIHRPPQHQGQEMGMER